MNNNNGIGASKIGQLIQKVKSINAGKKIVKKTVEITTKISYTYEDYSKKEVNK